MSQILGYIKNLHLTLQEWVGVAIAGIIGALVTALKVQGSQLHKAQVKVLDLTRKPIEDFAVDTTSKANKAYEDALNKYLNAGGTLAIALMLAAFPRASQAQDKAYQTPGGKTYHLVDTSPSCPEVLKKCDILVKAQAEEIRVMTDSRDMWRKMANNHNEHDAAPVVVSSTVSGALAGGIFGAAIGLGLGAVVGITVGIILDEVF